MSNYDDLAGNSGNPSDFLVVLSIDRFMTSANPYQSSHLVDASDPPDRVARHESGDEITVPESSRRVTRIGRILLGGYFTVLFGAWLSISFSLFRDAHSGWSRYVQTHPTALSCLLAIVALGLSGGVLCSFTPRRERVYWWAANLFKMLFVAVGFRVLFRVGGGTFPMNLLPLFSAVLFAIWMIGEASLLGFLRVTAFRNHHRIAGHLCELAIVLLALAAGCLSAWAVLALPASSHVASNLLLGVMTSFSVAQLVALYVIRWFSIIDPPSTQSSL